MKRYLAFIGSLLIAASVLCACSSSAKVNMADTEITAVFKYNSADITASLSEGDCEAVRRIFNGKAMFSDSPSCGFDENVALISNGVTYCIACDTCGLVYVAEDDKYFSLSDEENETLRSLLGEYGFTFPCL